MFSIAFRGIRSSLWTKRWRNLSSDAYTLCSQESGIRRIVLNNPKKRNALSYGMLESIKQNLLHNLDQSVRVVIISANGPVFSSGHDLKELTAEKGKEFHQKVFHLCSEVMCLIQDLPVPVVTQVNGLATAAGCQLVASTDITIATDKSKFATPGVNIGLFCSTPGVALGRAVPRKIAMEMLFTGNPITAHEAHQYGMVNKVVSEEQLEEETMKIVDKICTTSQPVVALGKATFYDQMAQSRNAAYRQAGDVMVENLTLADGKEGIKAFIEKRKPIWCHSSDCK